ncbi:MAG: aminoacetone oxidase family FAD-binding enzyme [Rhodobacteraceae bacterium]|nr:MAG: aminoacetone oxidase family FAD-binding enzyme [Paracoccaceae bacterium]
MKNYDVIIIGAGAAGMMCAIEAGRRGRRVLLLDHAKSVGEKIRISGGGRCNFTNLHIAPEKFLSQNPRFALSALKRYTQWDFIDRITQAGIAYHEKTLGQLFCDVSAKDIIAMLKHDMAQAGVDIALDCQIDQVVGSDGYQVVTSRGGFAAQSLVVACGGKSIPKMGATDFGYQLAKYFDHSIIETRPALVPLTFAKQELAPIAAMAGTSVFASVTCHKTSFDEGFLFTHRGLSGPSILQISSYWREGDSLSINLATESDVFQGLKDKRKTAGKQSLPRVLSDFIPKTIAQFVINSTGMTGNLADQSDKNLQAIADAVHRWQVKPVGSEGYRTAEVTLGGVNTDELDAKTLMSKNAQGLFFIGEVVDVTGWLGGYNFQWAWSSGWAAGQVV